ncbi:MAG: hypothetical protein PHG67_08935 [Bacteroidales bacterium]|jgi:hypothetical protein|nr:hypothetical protein [Bacteroidales bacterium]HOI31790.1 hypothetical protein [Bacteroidales bacterium]
MKRVLLMAVAALFFVACQNQSEKSTETSKEPVVVEGPIVITVGSFDEQAAELVGKEVIITGTADHICKHDGKKLFLIDVEEEGRVKITSGEGVPAFNSEFEGYDFKVTGIVDEMIVDEEYLREWEEEVIAGIDETRHLGGGEPMTEEERAAGVHLDDPAMEQIAAYREMMAEQGTDKLSFYSIVCSKFEVIEDPQ